MSEEKNFPPHVDQSMHDYMAQSYYELMRQSVPPMPDSMGSYCAPKSRDLFDKGGPKYKDPYINENGDVVIDRSRDKSKESVNHPSHYNDDTIVHSTCGKPIEVIEYIEHLPGNLFNVVKYIQRANLKHDDPLEDLKKAQWYMNREVERIERKKKSDS